MLQDLPFGVTDDPRIGDPILVLPTVPWGAAVDARLGQTDQQIRRLTQRIADLEARMPAARWHRLIVWLRAWGWGGSRWHAK